jgi:hypothetical protein
VVENGLSIQLATQNRKRTAPRLMMEEPNAIQIERGANGTLDITLLVSLMALCRSAAMWEQKSQPKHVEELMICFKSLREFAVLH